MSRQVRILLPVLALLLATCSWSTSLAVLNRRTEPIRITYFAQPLRTPPMVAAIDHVAERRESWLKSDSSLVRSDSGTRTVRVGPDSLVVLAEMGTYTGYRDELADWFEIKRLEILTSSGA